MKKAFTNSSRVTCIFSEDGIAFYGTQQEVFFPYGCLDSIRMNFLGVLRAVCRTRICSFAVDSQERAAVRELVHFAQEAMKTAPKAEPLAVDLTCQSPEAQIPHTLPPEVQLERYQALFVQGVISKDAYEMKKRWLRP